MALLSNSRSPGAENVSAGKKRPENTASLPTASLPNAHLPNAGALGISDTTRPRDWAPLTAAESARVLAAFGLRQAAPPSWQSGRPFSAGALVQLVPDQRKSRLAFVKRHDARLRTKARLETEHRFARHLASRLETHGFEVPLALTARDGSTVWRDGESVYEVFPAFEGEDLYREVPSWEAFRSLAHARSAGEALAHVHQASESFVPFISQRPPQSPAERSAIREAPLVSGSSALLAPDLKDGLATWIATQAGLRESLERLDENWESALLSVLTPFHARLKPLLGHVKPLWGHGDWHGSNLSWLSHGPARNAEHDSGHDSGHGAGRGSVQGVFDFGLSTQTSAPFDLAVAIERNFVRWMEMSSPDPVVWDQMRVFLNGYESVRPHTPQERALTGAFLPLAHVQFALSEIAYYAALLNDDAAARIAWEAYLLGHARWFGTPDGARLVSEVQGQGQAQAGLSS